MSHIWGGLLYPKGFVGAQHRRAPNRTAARVTPIILYLLKGEIKYR